MNNGASFVIFRVRLLCRLDPGAFIVRSLLHWQHWSLNYPFYFTLHFLYLQNTLHNFILYIYPTIPHFLPFQYIKNTHTPLTHTLSFSLIFQVAAPRRTPAESGHLAGIFSGKLTFLHQLVDRDIPDTIVPPTHHQTPPFSPRTSQRRDTTTEHHHHHFYIIFRW